jgi:hypothetical protein
LSSSKEVSGRQILMTITTLRRRMGLAERVSSEYVTTQESRCVNFAKI